jgi:hypothetical protein
MDELKLKTSFFNMVLHFQILDTKEKLLAGTSSKGNYSQISSHSVLYKEAI